MANPEKMLKLARMKTLATSLLVAVVVILIVARMQGWP